VPIYPTRVRFSRFAALQEIIRYWTNNEQRLVLWLMDWVADDPKAALFLS
jgi:hypothetical protein